MLIGLWIIPDMTSFPDMSGSGGNPSKLPHSQNTYELLNLRALKFSPVDKIYSFRYMSKIFCVEFQRYPLKFHTKYLTHTLKVMIFIYNIEILRALGFKSSNAFLKHPPVYTLWHIIPPLSLGNDMDFPMYVFIIPRGCMVENVHKHDIQFMCMHIQLLTILIR